MCGSGKSKISIYKKDWLFFWAFLCSPKCRPQGQHGKALKSAHPPKNAPQSVFQQCPCRKACLQCSGETRAKSGQDKEWKVSSSD